MTSKSDEDELYRGMWRAKAEGDTEYLIEVLRRYPDKSTLAVKWLRDWGEVDAIPELTRLLTAARPETRGAAAHALADLGPPPEARPILETMAASDPDAAARSRAYSTLGKYRASELLPFLVDALTDDDWRIRNGAAGPGTGTSAAGR